MSAAIALFAVSAFAQSDDAKNKQGQEREYAKNKDKSDKDKFDNAQYDVDDDGIFSPEERDARKADKIAWKADRKADRRADKSDDGLLNGSTHKDNHGRDVSGTARGTTLEGREKGKAVSDIARSNGQSGERMQGAGMSKPAKAARPSGSPDKAARPSGSGKSSGAGRKNK